MMLSPTLLTAVGTVAALAVEYTLSRASLAADIRTECLSWGSLALILWVSRRSKGDNALRISWGPSRTLNLEIWAVSVCTAMTRILSTNYDVVPALPLVTAITLFLSQLFSLKGCFLPGPGAAGNALDPASFVTLKRQIHWPRMVSVAFLAILGYFLHPLTSAEGSAGLMCFMFVILRTASFLLLEACRQDGLQSTDASFYIAKAIVFRVFCITTAIMIAFPPQSPFVWPMMIRAFGNIAELGATFCLVLLGYAVPATTIDTYSTATIGSFMLGNAGQAFFSALISVISIAQSIICLPSSASVAGRRLLVALAVIPVLSTFSTQLGVSWAADSGSQWGASWIQNGVMSGSSFNPKVHPIEHLAAESNARYQQMIKKQSQTLQDACAEYERRYGRRPPPNFDRWFEAAQKNNFLLVDEFDTMMAAIEPLWGVSAADIRGRVNNALDAGRGSMIRFDVRNHRVSYTMEGLAPWMATQVRGWFDQEMLESLPDIVFAVNTRDEPKVVVPHDALKAALAVVQTPRPGVHVDDPELSRRVSFIEVGKQNAWEALTVSCPIDSPARGYFSQTTHTSEVSDVGLISNVSMSKDICQFPFLRDYHSLLLEPESLSITHSLVPIFSQSKLSCFQDLLYPSPWYAAKLDMQEYREHDDKDWEEKENVVYWTGSTTGGHSSMNNWRSFQRQRLALMIEDSNRPITVLSKSAGPGRANGKDSKWSAVNSTLAEIYRALDIRISAVIQCDEDACKDQAEAFSTESKSRDDLSASYAAQYNLDLDGNGFSGRYYRLLRSKSAVLKQTLQKEWHDDWLIPWVHYVPLSMDLNDFPEIVRYLTQDPEGKALGKAIAEQSREWANTVLRKVDMKLVFWRLMLEYARVLDEDRDTSQCC